MGNAGQAGNSGGGAGGQGHSHDLGNAPGDEHDDGEGQADVVKQHKFFKVLLEFYIGEQGEEPHNEKDHHPQDKEMNVDESEGGPAIKGKVLGEFPVKDTAGNGQHGIQKGEVDILFH